MDFQCMAFKKLSLILCDSQYKMEMFNDQNRSLFWSLMQLHIVIRGSPTQCGQETSKVARRTVELTIPEVSSYICASGYVCIEIFSKMCYLVRSLIWVSVIPAFEFKSIAIRNLYFPIYLEVIYELNTPKEAFSIQLKEMYLCANWVQFPFENL